MRPHSTLDDATVHALDARVGARQRSAFITVAVRRALEDDHRWQSLQASIGAVSESIHDWHADPAGWVRS